MTGGIIIGGWEFVWAAYGITFTVLAGYGVSLIVRLRADEARSDEETR